MRNIDQLSKNALALKAKGMNESEIARELSLSRDTVTWLLTKDVESDRPPRDVNVGWRAIGVSPQRIDAIGAIMADIISEELARYNKQNKKEARIEAVAGVELNGIVFASSVAQQMGAELVVYHPSPNLDECMIRERYASPEGKTVAIVDDVLTTGGTARRAIQFMKKQKANPVIIMVLVNKTESNEIDGIPLRGVLRAAVLA